MSRAAALMVVLATAAGCDGESEPPPDGPTPPWPEFVPGPNLVTLSVALQTPFYIRYRDGDGPWTTPAMTDAQTYELHITNAYDVVVLCGGLGSYDAGMLKRTFADGASAFMTCYAGGRITWPTVGNVWEVDGVMKQKGEVSFGDYDAAAFGPWSFSFDVSEGMHDLIAIGETRMLIRRDIAVTSDMTLAPIDVAVDGLPFDTVSFASNAIAGLEDVRSSLELDTATEFARITGTQNTLDLPPASLLVPGDRMFARISASTRDTSRSVTTPFTGGNDTYTLPPNLTNIEYSYPYRQPWATWGTLPPFTELSLALFSFTSRASQSVSCSASYLEATHRSWLSFYPLPDDYDMRFTVDVVGPYFRSFSRYHAGASGVSDESRLDETVNFP